MKRVAPILALFLLVASGTCGAQTFGGAFDGMRNSDEPIQIAADRLEVADEEGTAVFHGNVEVNQGSTLLKTSRLKVYYVRESGGFTGPGGNVRRIEATDGVTVKSGDQQASADSAEVDMETQIAVLRGNVSVSQGNNIIDGCVVTVHMRTNNIDVKPCGGRVKVLIDRAPEAGDGQ